MKVQVRLGMFETNSSSVHTLTMCSRKQLEDWKRGDIVYDGYNDDFVPIDELNEHDLSKLDNDMYYTYEGFYNSFGEDYETFERSQILDNGQEVIGFGYFGHD